MEIIKHDNKNPNSDHKFTHTEIRNFLNIKLIQNNFFLNYRLLINSDCLYTCVYTAAKHVASQWVACMHAPVT
jgi:hypothetical protein